MENSPQSAKSMDQVLKELGDLYDFYRKIRQFKFVRKNTQPLTAKEDPPAAGRINAKD